MSISYPRSRSQRIPPRLGLIRFEGRASRSQWWLVMAIAYVLVWVIAMPRIMNPSYQPEPNGALDSGVVPIGLAILIIVLLALGIALALAVSVRRLHDRGRSGWWVLLYCVPVIGQLWLFLELGVLPGTRRPNRYG